MKDKKPQKKLSPVTIRLTDKQHQGLSDICATTGADNAFLVRVAVSGLLDYVKANGGHLHLPLDFTTAWMELHEIIESLEKSPAKTKSIPSTNSGHRPREIGSPLDQPLDPPAAAPISKPGNGEAR